MAKSSIADSQMSPTEQTTLDEFCALLSVDDRRPELIAAFNHSERAHGIVKDLSSSFLSRFQAFATAKV